MTAEDKTLLLVEDDRPLFVETDAHPDLRISALFFLEYLPNMLARDEQLSLAGIHEPKAPVRDYIITSRQFQRPGEKQGAAAWSNLRFNHKLQLVSY